MTVNYVNKNVKARNINKKKSQASRGKQNKKTGHVQRTRNQNSIRPEDNGALPSKCWEKITTNLEFYTRINYQLNVKIE